MPLDLPPVTRNLLIANVVVYLLQQFFGEVFLQYFALWPWGPDQVYQTAQGLASIGFRPWQLVTYAFMHGGLPHIAFNMFALFMFGGTIERTFGARNFIVYYFVCAIVAAIAQLLVLHYFSPEKFFPTLGASGAIFGLLLAFGMLYPHEKMMLIFLPVPIPAWIFVIGYAAVELVLGVTGTQAGVAHFAHLGGMVGGIVLIQYWRGRLPIKPKRRLMR
ncbi:rhomboid family intramembrane serine protease [Rhodanobacter lindaniclasticus]|jgi:membrane associated rhomboid family serine protease|uniref:Rhomboid family intramembrane serine protease n=1 Tax=Rhodanobacter lindaniclasticus TaxID=75310 RepID=A0A4S3KJ93_9GAMM|nr:rhomboid family intramembrane serine protease [Rhodanobacter lindaniclasticus]THD08837.1 rhomboid family intramembrane serine protease [Rhodanobacter lindaniclasticus]